MQALNVPVRNMKKIVSINPSNAEVIGSVNVSSDADVKGKVQKAIKAKKHWKEIDVKKRAGYLKKIAVEIERRKEEVSVLASKEMGMPISQSRMDSDGAIEFLNWYADNAEKYLSEEVVYKDKTKTHKVWYEPLGVCASITPWNFPASNFVWMVGQSLVAGNTIVLKNSEEVPLFGN